MAFDENIKTGQAYRVLVDTDPVTGKNTYDRISTWTAASDIEFSNNTILEAFVNSFRYAEGGLQAGRNSVTISGENITERGMLEIYVDDDFIPFRKKYKFKKKGIINVNYSLKKILITN